MKIIKDLGMSEYGSQGRKRRYVIVECPICNKHFRVSKDNINSGNTTKCISCSRRISKTKHGIARTKIYNIWRAIKKRCFNANSKQYHDYGGRGITVCSEWQNNPILFYKWAVQNGYKEGLTIDRIDNDGNYEPSNCRWTTRNIQQRNSRRLRKNNTSGYRGVCFSKNQNQWTSYMTVDSKRKHLGLYDLAKEAALAYDTFIIVYGLEHTRNFA